MTPSRRDIFVVRQNQNNKWLCSLEMCIDNDLLLQELYGRIRLCSRMLADHFIPVYLGALESALQSIESDYSEEV